MPVATMSYPSNSPTAGSQQQQQQQQQSSNPLPPPAREFLVNVEMWCTFGSLKQSKNKVKSSRSRPSSSIFTGSASASASQDDLALAHSLSATTDGFSHYSVATSNNSTMSNVSKKTGISSLFSSGSHTASEIGGIAGPAAERAAKAGAAGFWRGAVCKLSGEGGIWPGSNSATPTGSALLTIYSSDDNTLQHVINVHKLTSTDVRSTDKSLYGRSDVLAIWGHPAAMSLTTHPTLDPIYLSFSSPDAHNTWLVLLRSYTSPEIYGRMIAPEKSTGGLYRMWRQIEMVVVQSRGVGLSTPASLLTQTPTHVKERKSIGGLFGKDKDLVVPGLNLSEASGSRPSTATSNGTTTTGLTSTSGGTATDIIPLGLTSSHTPSVATGSTSFISTTGSTASTGTTGSGGQTPMPSADDPGTPIARTISLRSYSTSSLPTSESDANNGNGSGTGGTGHSPVATTNTRDLAKAAKEKEKEREKREREREKEKERERKEKERKEKEKQREKEKKKFTPPPAFFAEIVLDGEVCGRTTVKRPPAPLHSSSSSTPSGRPSTAPSGSTPSHHASLVSNNSSSAQGPEWFENFLFGDLPSFGSMLVSLWKAPEKGPKDEKDKNKPGSNTNSAGSTSNTSMGSATLNNQSVVSGLTNSSTGGTSSANSRGSAATGKRTLVNGTGAASGVTMYGGAKGTQFLGCVEISIPNFRRGEWVEGWWPVYAHANSLTGGVNKDGIHHSGGISQLGMGMGAMGMGGMSGVGGVAGAMVQVGELKLKIKVDEEIILPSKAYKNVLDALEQRNYLDVLSDLEQKLRIDHAMISNHIVSLAVARNRLLKDIVQLAEREVNGVQGSTNTLFRGNTVLTKTMELAMAWYGRGFLDASVGPIIRRMIAENVEIEVDPSRLPHVSKRRPSTKESLMNPGEEKESLQEQGIRLLEYWCNEFWSQIYFVRMECPVELRRLFGHIRMMVEHRFNVSGRQFDFDPNDPTSGLMSSAVGMGADMLPWQAISSFVFLRFIVPAVLNPHLFGICPGMPPKGVVRSLTLLAKCTQTLANLNPGAPLKEQYMGGIRNCLERNTVTMIDYLSCVSSLPDQFSPTANSSSFLSGPDKHDRLHVINSLRERLTGAGNTIPTLYKDAIPLLPYALDVPKHLAILSSAVVRNSRTGGGAGLYGGRTGSAGIGAEQDPAGGWSLTRFSDLCFDVEAQALKSVATLAQGAASAGAFGPRTKRSTSVSSTGGLNGQQHGRPSSSRGITPTGAPATAGTSGGNASPAMATTPTQTSPAPWNNQVRRPASSRSIVTPTGGGHASNASPGPSPGGNGSTKHSPGGIYNQASGSPMGSSAQVVTLMPPTKRKSSARPSTAPSSTSAGATPNDSFIRERKVSNNNQGFAIDASPAAASFRYLPPEQPSYPHEARAAEDSGMPETPISSEPHSPYGSTGSGGRKTGYPTMHRAESETYVPFHYPSRYQGSAEGLRPSGSSATEKSERRSSRIRDFMRRPATSSGSPSVSAPASATSQRPPWTWGGTADTGVGHQQQQNYNAGDDFMNSPSQSQPRGTRNASGSIGNSSGENYGTTTRRKVERTDTAASGEPKKKKGLFGWLKK